MSEEEFKDLLIKTLENNKLSKKKKLKIINNFLRENLPYWDEIQKLSKKERKKKMKQVRKEK